MVAFKLFFVKLQGPKVGLQSTQWGTRGQEPLRAPRPSPPRRLFTLVCIDKTSLGEQWPHCFPSCVWAQSCPTVCTPWTPGAARQAPLSMGFSGQEYWRGLPFPTPGIKLESPVSPAQQAFFTTSAAWKPALLSSAVGLVAQSWLTLCDPIDCSPPGFSVHRDSSGESTGVGSLSRLQRIFPTQGSNPGLPHCRRILYHQSHQGILNSFKTVKGMLLVGWFPFEPKHLICGSLKENKDHLSLIRNSPDRVLLHIGLSVCCSLCL